MARAKAGKAPGGLGDERAESASPSINNDLNGSGRFDSATPTFSATPAARVSSEAPDDNSHTMRPIASPEHFSSDTPTQASALVDELSSANPSVEPSTSVEDAAAVEPESQAESAIDAADDSAEQTQTQEEEEVAVQEEVAAPAEEEVAAQEVEEVAAQEGDEGAAPEEAEATHEEVEATPEEVEATPEEEALEEAEEQPQEQQEATSPAEEVAAPAQPEELPSYEDAAQAQVSVDIVDDFEEQERAVHVAEQEEIRRQSQSVEQDAPPAFTDKLPSYQAQAISAEEEEEEFAGFGDVQPAKDQSAFNPFGAPAHAHGRDEAAVWAALLKLNQSNHVSSPHENSVWNKLLMCL
jgi:hypothetical protein